MNRRQFMKWLPAGVAKTRRQPNLLFVFSDQQSWDMLGCYGNPQIVTPNLDRFAKQGIRFNHCVSNSPLCTPYRGNLLSGQHPLRTGALENDIRMLAGGGNYFGEVLRDAGYQLGYIGKWHLYGGNRVRAIPPGPHRYGFDHTFLSNNCTVVFDKERAYYWDEQGSRQLYGDWEPYAQSRQAMEFIDQNTSRPFALFVSWHPPHNWTPKAPVRNPEDGYGAPEDLLELYDPQTLKLRGNCADTPSMRRLYRGHMAMCTSIDRAFGWLVDRLEKRGLAEDTIVVFTSDHGDTLYSHGFRHNKMRPEVESIRVPLLLRYPRRLKPRVSELLFGTLDFMPTLLSLMGIRAPDACQGKNLSRAIAAGRDNEVDAVPLFLYAADWRGLYTRRHTYSFDTNRGEWSFYRQSYFRELAGIRWNCLYDRESDRWETKNLYVSPEHSRLRGQLHEQTLSWMKRFDDDGLSRAAVARAAFAPEDVEREDQFKRGSGVLRGRPIDLLRGLRAL